MTKINIQGEFYVYSYTKERWRPIDEEFVEVMHRAGFFVCTAPSKPSAEYSEAGSVVEPGFQMDGPHELQARREDAPLDFWELSPTTGLDQESCGLSVSFFLVCARQRCREEAKAPR